MTTGKTTKKPAQATKKTAAAKKTAPAKKPAAAAKKTVAATKKPAAAAKKTAAAAKKTVAAKKSAPPKKAAAPKPTSAAAKATKPVGPRPSAGPRILKDLGLTDAELQAFLPADAPKWIRYVFACDVTLPLEPDAIARHFADRFEVTVRDERPRSVSAPPDTTVRVVSLRPKGKYVSYTFTPTLTGPGRYQLQVALAGSDTGWGSNRAIYERFKKVELPGLGATDLVEVES